MSQQFLWLGNCLVLDFVNTQVLHDGPVEELLLTPTDLLQWLRDAGLATASTISSISGGLGEKELYKALALGKEYRSHIRGSLGHRGFKDSLATGLLKETNDLLSVATRTNRLETGRHGAKVLTAEWQFSSSADFLRPIAHSLAEMLGQEKKHRIRRCRNPDCILYFYDVSRGNTRVWCSPAICGNKMRVARFRKKHDKA